MFAKITAVITPWKKVITYLSIILFSLHAFSWWLFFMSPFNIPIRTAPLDGTRFNLPGAVVILITIFTLLYFQRKIRRTLPEVKISTLTCLSVIPLIIAEFLIQLFVWILSPDDSFIDLLYYNLLLGTVCMSLLYLILSLIIAFIRKNHDTRLFAIICILFLLGCYVIGRYLLPS